MILKKRRSANFTKALLLNLAVASLLYAGYNAVSTLPLIMADAASGCSGWGFNDLFSPDKAYADSDDLLIAHNCSQQSTHTTSTAGFCTDPNATNTNYEGACSYQSGYQNSYQSGYQNSYQSGYTGSYQSGYTGSYQSGYQGGYQSGYTGTYQGGYTGTYQSGYTGSYTGPYEYDVDLVKSGSNTGSSVSQGDRLSMRHIVTNSSSQPGGSYDILLYPDSATRPYVTYANPSNYALQPTQDASLKRYRNDGSSGLPAGDDRVRTALYDVVSSGVPDGTQLCFRAYVRHWRGSNATGISTPWPNSSTTNTWKYTSYSNLCWTVQTAWEYDIALSSRSNGNSGYWSGTNCAAPGIIQIGQEICPVARVNSLSSSEGTGAPFHFDIYPTTSAAYNYLTPGEGSSGVTFPWSTAPTAVRWPSTINPGLAPGASSRWGWNRFVVDADTPDGTQICYLARVWHWIGDGAGGITTSHTGGYYPGGYNWRTDDSPTQLCWTVRSSWETNVSISKANYTGSNNPTPGDVIAANSQVTLTGTSWYDSTSHFVAMQPVGDDGGVTRQYVEPHPSSSTNIEYFYDTDQTLQPNQSPATGTDWDSVRWSLSPNNLPGITRASPNGPVRTARWVVQDNVPDGTELCFHAFVTNSAGEGSVVTSSAWEVSPTRICWTADSYWSKTADHYKHPGNNGAIPYTDCIDPDIPGNNEQGLTPIKPGERICVGFSILNDPTSDAETEGFWSYLFVDNDGLDSGGNPIDPLSNAYHGAYGQNPYIAPFDRRGGVAHTSTNPDNNRYPATGLFTLQPGQRQYNHGVWDVDNSAPDGERFCFYAASWYYNGDGFDAYQTGASPYMPALAPDPVTGQVYARDRSDGTLCWEADAERFHINTPTVVGTRTGAPGEIVDIDYSACNNQTPLSTTYPGSIRGDAPGIVLSLESSNTSGTWSVLSPGSPQNITGTNCISQTSQFTIPLGASVGDSYCFRARTNYKAGWSDGTGLLVGPVGGNVSAGTGLDCVVVSERPYIHVDNGDVLAGAQFSNAADPLDTSAASCTANTQNPRINTVLNTSRNVGSMARYGAFAIGGSIGGFGSGVLKGGDIDNLTYANDSGLGNFRGGSGEVLCLPDYYDYLSASSVYDQAVSSTSITNLNTYANQIVLVNNDVTINSSSQLGSPVTLVVNGDVNINQDILYNTTNTYSSVSQVPILTIVSRGVIRVAPTVDTISGVFIAQPDSPTTGGVINTCNRNSTRGVMNILDTGESCGRQLVVNGKFIAKEIRFLRTGGGVIAEEFDDSTCEASNIAPGSFDSALNDRDDQGRCSAEIFISGPESILAEPLLGPVSDPFDSSAVDLQRDLPPIF